MLQQILEKMIAVEDQNKKILKELGKLNNRFDKLERRKAVISEKNAVEDMSLAVEKLKSLRKFNKHARISYFSIVKMKQLRKKNFERLDRSYAGFLREFGNQTHSLRLKGQRVYVYDGKTFELVQDKKTFWRELRMGLAENFTSSFKEAYLTSEGVDPDDYNDRQCWEPHFKFAYQAFTFCEVLNTIELCKFKKLVCGPMNNKLIDQIRKLTN